MVKKKPWITLIIVLLMTMGGYFFRGIGGFRIFSPQEYEVTTTFNYNDQSQQYIINTSATHMASGVTVQLEAATSDKAAVNSELFQSLAEYFSKHKMEDK